MTRFLGVLLYLTFSLLSLSVEAQIPFLRQYTVSEGLPTNEVFYVYQDYKMMCLACNCLRGVLV